MNVSAWLQHERRCGRSTPISPNNVTLQLFDPHVTRLYQTRGPATKNKSRGGLKASSMIPGPLVMTLTQLLP